MQVISVSGHNVNNLPYAGETVMIAENEVNLQEMLTIFAIKISKCRSLRTKKDRCKSNHKETVSYKCNIIVNGPVLNKVSVIEYVSTSTTAGEDELAN